MWSMCEYLKLIAEIIRVNSNATEIEIWHKHSKYFFQLFNAQTRFVNLYLRASLGNSHLVHFNRSSIPREFLEGLQNIYVLLMSNRVTENSQQLQRKNEENGKD